MKLQIDNFQEEARIEIVPLIDVIFCILTFFILAALQLTRQQAINVDLPKADTGKSQGREMLVVSVDSNGQTFLEKDPVDRLRLKDAITAYRQQKPNGLMVLYASKTSRYNDVVQVLDLLKSVGGDRVALATLPGPGESTPNNSNNLPTNNNLPNLPIPDNNTGPNLLTPPTIPSIPRAPNFNNNPPMDGN